MRRTDCLMGRSTFGFTRFMAVVVRELRSWNIPVLTYLDCFLIAPSKPGTFSTPENFRKTADHTVAPLRHLSLVRYLNNLVQHWNGNRMCTQTLVHIGVKIDTAALRFRIASYKLLRVKQLEMSLFNQVRFGRRWISKRARAYFCDVYVSLSSAMPYAGFYTRSLHWDIADR